MWGSLGAVIAALVLALFVTLFGSASTYTAPPPSASSTALATLPELTPPALFVPALAPSIATSSLQAPVKKPAATQNTPPAATAPQASSPVLPPVQVAPSGDLAAASAVLRSSLVNILCYAPVGSRIKSISGSGVMINPKGIILTNAHIGQYFLLASRGVSCTIRTGSPAANAYTASLIFISPTWVHDNAAVITESLPTGTGEHDLAFLAITGSATTALLPSTFPAIALEEQPPVADEPVVIGSYAAQFLDTTQIQSSLYPTIVYGSIKHLYTFVDNTVDVVSLGGSAAAQEGSSGGGVADAWSELAATVTTSTVTGDTADRTLSAITATYIRRDVQAELGRSLDSLLAEPLADSVSAFAASIAPLESVILQNLN